MLRRCNKGKEKEEQPLIRIYVDAKALTSLIKEVLGEKEEGKPCKKVKKAAKVKFSSKKRPGRPAKNWGDSDAA